MLGRMTQKSTVGDTIEGFVIRIRDGFKDSDFEKSVAKFVRQNHVQTDSEWLKKWKQAKLKK
jgi:hypothetical protein